MNSLFDKKTYVFLFVGFFVLETVLSVWTGMQYDMNIWFNTGKWMEQGINIYAPADHVGYLPLWPFWCGAAYRIYMSSANNMEVWRFTIKLPLILANLALAFAMGEYALTRFDLKIARKVFLFTLTGSFFIFIGAMWGQINTLSALLTFLAFYALTRGKTNMSALLLGVAVTLKIYPLIALPALFTYTLKNKGWRGAGRYVFITAVVPVVFTGVVFVAFQWDITDLFRTIFYWTPAYGTPTQIQGGAMNIWSFTSLLGADVSQMWVLRLVWIPLLAIAAIYWLRRPHVDEETLCLSLISFYTLFMMTYSWVPEQTFVDLLPFVLLQILAFRPRKVYLYLLAALQVLVYAFAAVDCGPFVFLPLLERYPDVLAAIQPFNPVQNNAILVARGVLGFGVSVLLGIFLLVLAEPSLIDAVKRERKEMSANSA